VGYEVDEEEGEHKYFQGTFKAFQEKTRKTCDRCHATNYADLEASAHGSKGGLTCVKCHGFHTIKGTEFNPAKLETSCGQSGCHKELVDGYKDNVHAAGYKKGNKFAPTCMHCHGSTHRLRAVDSPAQAKPGLTWGTWFNRSQCYRCHSILGKEFSTSHEFLYPAELHLGPKLGCACHTEKTGGLHSLGANNQPVSGKAKEEICSLCHTPEGALLPAVKDTYVIGATRNKWFDYIGIAIVALTFVGMVLGHGGLRFLTGMLRKAKG
jgi:hypothetical protein